jgi:RNA polymerase sigma-70 factor (ECF subfamily)
VLLGIGDTVREARAGAEESFEELFQRWRPDVVTLCRRLLGRVGDAEDAAQEALLRAWMAREHYSPVRPFWPWLATITRRLCIDQRRRFAREQAGGALLDAEQVDAGIDVAPERVVELAEDLQIVFRAIDSLHPVQRRALVRREVDGWSYQRIASAEGVTVEAVRGSLKRARATVRQSVLHEAVFDSVPRRVLGAQLRADDREQHARPRLSNGNFSPD